LQVLGADLSVVPTEEWRALGAALPS